MRLGAVEPEVLNNSVTKRVIEVIVQIRIIKIRKAGQAESGCFDQISFKNSRIQKMVLKISKQNLEALVPISISIADSLVSELLDCS